MAVSLTQLHREASQRRAMAQYPLQSGYMPVAEYFQHSPQQQYYQPGWVPPPPPPLPPKHEYASPQYQAQPSQYEQRPPAPPPRPPKEQIETTPSHIENAISIEPDPLPPHTNPQALTQTQSQAFSNSQPIPPVRIGKEEIWNAQTGYALYVISREAGHLPSFLSTKPLLFVTRASNGSTVGSIRFHSLTTTAIDLAINGRNTSLSHSGLIHNRWGFLSTTVPNSNERWYWKKDKSSGGAKLEDSKKSGTVLARMKGDMLTFEQARLSNASYDEVLLSAIAMADAARRQKRNGDVADLAFAIGEFASSAGGVDGGGGDWGGGGGA